MSAQLDALLVVGLEAVERALRPHSALRPQTAADALVAEIDDPVFERDVDREAAAWDLWDRLERGGGL